MRMKIFSCNHVTHDVFRVPKTEFILGYEVSVKIS